MDKISRVLNLANAGERYNVVSAGALDRLPADGKVGVLLMIHTVGHDPIRAQCVSAELTADKGGIGCHPRRFVEIDGKALFPALFRRLRALQPTYYETLPAASGGYDVVSDGFSARYLPGRNVVIVTTRYSGVKKVLQMDEWQRVQVKLLALAMQMRLEAEAHGEAGARNAGKMADDFLEGSGVRV